MNVENIALRLWSSVTDGKRRPKSMRRAVNAGIWLGQAMAAWSVSYAIAELHSRGSLWEKIDNRKRGP